MYFNSSPMHGSSHKAQSKTRILQLMLLVFLLLTIAFVILYTGALTSRSTYNVQLKQQIRSEVDLALAQLNTLSRTGGSSTDSVLAKARQHVYAAKVITDQSFAFTGRHPLDPALFDTLLTMVDEFERRKQTGQATIETQTELIASLTDLRERANALLN